jgi:cell division transport system permease protein
VSRFRLLVSEAISSIRGNLSTSLAATVTVLIGMFLLGLFVAIGSLVLSWSEHVKSELLVKVVFLDDATPKQINVVRIALESDGRVKSVVFVSKNEALARNQKRYPEWTENLPTNPFPALYEVVPLKGEDTEAIAQAVRKQKLAGVEEVTFGRDKARRILQVARAIEVVFLLAVVVLLAAATVLIANTIRLSIFSRRREIEVMKLVGATNWFIRGPFMLEGLLCGFMGSVAAVALLLLGRELAVPAILGHIELPADVHALAFSLTALLLVGIGLGVGALGSGLTLRRFLKV